MGIRMRDAQPCCVHAGQHMIYIAVVTLGLLGTSHADVSLALHISDLHLSVFNQHYLPSFGDKEGDLHLFANTVLPSLKPDAVIFGGDLVDAKTLYMQGHQYREEWKDYRGVVEAFKAASGLGEEAILDLRGNHDAFDVPMRKGDWFSQYAAQGRRNGTSQVNIFPLFAPGSQSLLGHGCPAAVLVGLEVTPEPGLRGPTNFAGQSGPALLQELNSTLTEATAKYRSPECGPVFLAYGHHPLSTTLHPHIPLWRGLDRTSASSVYGMLSSHGVQVYVNGHLHSVFGQRIHALHKTKAGGRLLELETAAWKDDRRFRLLTFDNGTFSFTDLMFNTPSKPASRRVAPAPPPTPPSSFSVSGIDADVVVSQFLAVISSPPDARYSSLTLPPQGRPPPTSFHEVRALVMPMSKDAEASKVEVRWRCAEAHLEGSLTMKPQKGPAPVYTAPWNPKVSCGAHAPGGVHELVLQVVVSEASGQVSTSEERQVALITAKTGGSRLVIPRRRFPLNQTPLERFMLWFDWTRSMHKLFLLWCLIHSVFMLLLPKLLRQYIIPPNGAAVSVKLPAATKVDVALHKDAAAGEAQPQGSVAVDAGASSNRAVETAAGGLLSGLLWAPIILCQMSTYGFMWWPQMLFSVYIPVGPWFAARFLSNRPLGLYFAQGVVIISADGMSWQWHKVADTLIIVNKFMALTVLPGTLWLAWLVSSWSGTRPASVETRHQRAWWTRLAQLLVFLLVSAPHAQTLHHLNNAYGFSCILLAPVTVWCIPWVFATLFWLRRRTRLKLPHGKQN